MPLKERLDDQRDSNDLTIRETGGRPTGSKATAAPGKQSLISIVHQDIPGGDDFFPGMFRDMIGKAVHEHSFVCEILKDVPERLFVKVQQSSLVNP
jgi:hypothetical protein